MKLILHHSKRAVAVVENVLVVGLDYNILLWFSYYFASIDAPHDEVKSRKLKAP